MNLQINNGKNYYNSIKRVILYNKGIKIKSLLKGLLKNYKFKGNKK